MKINGKHVIVDYFGCLYDFESNELMSILLEAVKRTAANIVSVHEHRFQPFGRSITIILAESHFCCHTFSENASMSMDCYTCSSDTNPIEAHHFLLNILKPKTFDFYLFKRGQN